jgi:hypothetical protein
MAKKKIEKTEAAPVWGYGFQPEGTKWQAYRADEKGITSLSPPGGEQLHRAMAKIRAGLQQEVGNAMRRRA